MHAATVFGLVAAATGADALARGFNYGSTLSDGSAIEQAEYEALFQRAADLPGTSPFTSARLYTSIQADTTDTPSEAFAAAISTGTKLLLGIWCSAGASDVDDEITAITSAISTYGTSFTDLVLAISVGSEDLYRDSTTGIENDDGVGAGPATIVDYITQVKNALSGTDLSSTPVGHVDTWDAWTNSSNSAVITAVDWIGVDSYPYFETTIANGIADGKSDFFASVDAVVDVADGKDVWITETGWPVSGPTENDAVASIANAETYWQQVACDILGKYNTFWYTLTDSLPTTPSPSFGIIGSDLSSDPLYSLSCNSTSSSSSSSASSSKTSTASSKSTGVVGSGSTTSGSSGSSASGSSASAASDSSALPTAYTTASSAYSTYVTTMVSGSSTIVATTSTLVGYNGTSVVSGVSATGTAYTSSVGTASATESVTGSASASPISTNAAASAGSAIGAGILAIFGLVAVI